MEPGAGISLDFLGASVRMESVVAHFLQSGASDRGMYSLRMAGQAHLETAWDSEPFVLSVYALQQVYTLGLSSSPTLYGPLIARNVHF